MNATLVDTPIWSIALRRKREVLNNTEIHLTQTLRELIKSDLAQIIGPIRQELLSGLEHKDRFVALQDNLRAFSDATLEAQDYESAAQMRNRCRSKGVPGTAVDLLICAVSHRRNWRILTTDLDFDRYAKFLPINLYRR